MDQRDHWERVYSEGRKPSWYRPHLDYSVQLIESAGLDKSAPMIDVGGGDSTLVDDLLDRGYSDLTVLDISSAAIERARARLGRRAGKVKWMNTDITSAKLLPSHYAYWHDRAVFHFLVDAESRERYVSAVRRSLKPGGHIVVATFGPAGPEKCSGLDVVRYSPDQLHAEFGGSFRKISSRTEQHVTPWGTEQQFIYCYCRMP